MLFADLVGFTNLSETRDAEEVRDLLVRFAEVCRAVVERYGGYVDNFIGDAVFAVWGATVAHEDDAERAVRCGLDLIEAIAALGSEVKAPGLAARAGVLSGEAAINRGGPGERMVAGDLVNTASRLQTSAEAGTVLVGDATYSATNHAIAYADAGMLSLKGKEEPVRAWRALRVVAQRQGVGRREGIEAPFVGRVEELRTLKDALDGVGRERRARLVSITGIPGIGKSRLAWEFQKYVDGLIETIYWHHGRSPSYGEGISFWALSEMIRMRARITDDEDPASAKQKLADTLGEFVPPEEERNWIEARLAHLLGLADAPQGEREETFSAWRSFFEHISENAPVVMVFEDLQWADSGTIDFLESLLEWSRNYPILVVVLARPELFDRRANWGAAQRNFTSLHLEPLSKDAMSEMLKGMVQDLPESLASTILERAEGVPLYAIEFVRMLVGRGLLVEESGALRGSVELAGLELPDTLHSLVAARLDSLPADQRRLVQDASVLGKSFSVEALATLAGIATTALETQLRDLARKEILALDVDPRSPERGQYSFLQSVIREVAYSTLSKRDRIEKHVTAARYFETLSDAELIGVVAAHYLEAHRASPAGAERDELGTRACTTLAEAGKRASSLGAPEQALSFLEQALEISAGDPDAELSELAARAADFAGSPERALEHYERAIAAFRRAGDRDAVGRTEGQAAWILGRGLERHRDAVGRAERTFAELTDDVDPKVRAGLALVLSDLYFMIGESESAQQWADRALAVVETIDDQELLVEAIFAKGGALFNLGRHKEALILDRGATEMAESLGNLALHSRCLMAMAVCATDDEPQVSLRASQQALQIARRAGNRPLEMVNLLNVVEFATLLGEWEAARSAVADVESLNLDEQQHVHQVFRDSAKALLEALTGNLDEAEQVLERIGQGINDVSYIHSRATYLWYRGFVRLIVGDFERAFTDAESAVNVDPAGINAPSALRVQARAALWLRDAERAKTALEGMNRFRGRMMAAMRRTTEAGIAALSGDSGAAESAYDEAGRAWKDLGMPLDLALCELDAAFLLPDRQAAQARSVRAAEMLARLGVAPLLSLLELHQRNGGALDQTEGVRATPS